MTIAILSPAGRFWRSSGARALRLPVGGGAQIEKAILDMVSRDLKRSLLSVADVSATRARLRVDTVALCAGRDAA